MNVKLLRKIQKHILAEPRRLNMDKIATPQSLIATNLRPPCGTTCCIAGWAIVLTANKKVTEDDSFLRDGNDGSLLDACDAFDRLKLKDNQDEKLFFVRSWPNKFAYKYRTAKTQRGKARAAVARIDHFIKTRGVE